MTTNQLFTSDDLQFIDEQRVARLATTSAAGQPYVVPVCFARLGTVLYIGIDAKPKHGDPRELKRLRNLREQPQAVLLLDHYEEHWERLRWLSIRSRATILETGPERASALEALERRYPQYAAMALSTLGLPVIALEPIAVSRWKARR